MDIGAIRVTQLAVAGWQAQVLYTLTELEVFDILADHPLTADEVAQRADLHSLATELLLNSAVALKLLVKENDQFSNTPLARRLLCKESPESLARWVRIMDRWTDPWSQLATSIRTGAASEHASTRLRSDTDYVADFTLGMHQYALRIAEELALRIESPIEGIVIDVGGGCGTYSIALCRRNPNLQAQILELPTIIPFALQVIAEAQLSHRISVVQGDYLRDDLPEGASAVVLSNILHQETRSAGKAIVRRAYNSLKPGGRVIVNGYFLDDTRTAPPFAVLHSMSAFILWGSGGSYTVNEASNLLLDCGFLEPVVHSIADGASTLLVAAKPSGSQGLTFATRRNSQYVRPTDPNP